MKKVDARGDACPIPVVKAKHAIEELSGAGQVEVLVDNEIAVQNLTKMAEQKGYQSSAKKLADQEYQVSLRWVNRQKRKKHRQEPDAKPVFRTAVPIPWL